MRILTKLLLVATLAAPAAIAADPVIAGTWRGKMHDLPAVVLSVKDEGGRLSGTVVFHFFQWDDVHDVWKVDTKHSFPLPLIDPKFEGKTFTFEVSHREAHPPQTLNDPPASFQMWLTGENEARLKNLTEDQGEGLKMTRDSRERRAQRGFAPPGLFQLEISAGATSCTGLSASQVATSQKNRSMLHCSVLLQIASHTPRVCASLHPPAPI
jgi:hypothetical protein